MAELSITAASVKRSATSIAASVGIIAAGVTVTQGQALYQLADGTYGLSDSNGTTPANTFAGIALTAGSPGQPVMFCNADSAFITGATLAMSAPTIWVGNTPGSLTATYSDIASGSTVIQVGIVNTDLTLKLSPLTGGVK